MVSMISIISSITFRLSLFSLSALRTVTVPIAVETKHPSFLEFQRVRATVLHRLRFYELLYLCTGDYSV